MSLFEKALPLEPEEYVFRRALAHLGMRKILPEKLDKIMGKETENA